MQQDKEINAANEEQKLQQKIEKCPRCDSFNTKFCYYNNYSLSQPRYFCKACRRYWTHGGALRNVPIGGASRKPKRLKNSPSPSSSSCSSSAETQQVKLSSSSSSSFADAFEYLPSIEEIDIHHSLNRPRNLFDHSDDVVGMEGVSVYSFGLEQNITTNPLDASMWTINDTAISSADNSSRISDQNSMIPNPNQWSADGGDLPRYG